MKKLFFAAIALCGVMAVSCTKEGSDKNVKLGTGEPAEVIISIDGNAGGVSRAETVVGTEKESAVKMLELYVFESNGSIDTEVGKTSTTTGNGYISFTTNTNEVKRVIVSSGDNKKFVAVVNMNLGALATGETYTNLKKKIAKYEFLASNDLGNHNSRLEDRVNGFEMTGETTGNIVAGKVDNKIHIGVDRIVGRINAPIVNAGTGFVDLTVDQIKSLWGEDTELTKTDLTFKYSGYALVNGLNKSDAFFIGNATGDNTKIDQEGYYDWPDWIVTGKTYLKSSYAADGSYTNTYSGKLGSDWFLDGSIANNGHRVYVYENKPQEIVYEGQEGYDPASVYAFVIKGTLIVKGDATNANNLNKERYWRVDISEGKSDYHILRNSVYNVTIKKITSTGEATPEDAEEKPGVIPGKGASAADVQISVNPWTLYDYEREM